MSIFDRYRSNDDDALDLARKRAEAMRRMRALPAAPGTAAPRAPTTGAVKPTDPRSSGGLQPQPAPGGRLPANPGKGFMGGGVAAGPQVLPGGAGKAAEDDIDDLARTRAEREKERKAAEEELRLGKQRAVQQADARAGLAGFGLSGATSAQVGNVARAQDRTATLTLADLDRRQRDEDFQAIQRKAALADLEDAYDVDYDDDGKINGKAIAGTVGDGDPDNDAPPLAGRPGDRAPADYEGAQLVDGDYFSQYSASQQRNVIVDKIEGDSVWVVDGNKNPPVLVKMTRAEFEAFTGANLR